MTDNFKNIDRLLNNINQKINNIDNNLTKHIQEDNIRGALLKSIEKTNSGLYSRIDMIMTMKGGDTDASHRKVHAESDSKSSKNVKSMINTGSIVTNAKKVAI